jgi:hypothetical protein
VRCVPLLLQPCPALHVPLQHPNRLAAVQGLAPGVQLVHLRSTPAVWVDAASRSGTALAGAEP